ncbi:MAG: hypothetical protein ABIH23_32815, partial [bacterium]
NQRESRIKPEEEPPIQSAAPLPIVAEGFRLGLEPWFFFALLALLLLAVEWVLFHRRVVE